MASPEPIEGRCGATVSVSERNPDGGYCTKPPMRGQTRCGTHGGRAPQNRAAAERRIARQVAENAVATLGLRRDIAPEDALLEEIQWSAGHVAWLRQRVQELDPDALVWGLTETKDVGSGERPGYDVTEAAAPSVWWVLYREERKHLLALVHEAGVQKIEDRRIRLAERQGSLVAEVIRGAFEDVLRALVELGLGQALVDVWPDLVRRAVATRLRALGTGDDGGLAVTA